MNSADASKPPRRIFLPPDPGAVTDVAGPGSRPVRVVACIVTVAVGVFVVGGCLLSFYREAVGFGRPRDSGIRPGVVAPLLVGVAAGILLPTAGCVWAASRSRRTIVIVALTVAASAAALIVGILGLG